MTTETYQRPTKSIRDMTTDERAEHYDRCEKEIRKIMIDDTRSEMQRPISFRLCAHWQKVVMTVVQHDAGPNTITASHNGDVQGAWRLPLRYTKSSKIGQPIVRVLETIEPFQKAPPELGFLLIEVPGWLAGDEKRPLCQARSPVLSTAIEWTDAQRAAWERLRDAFFSHRDTAERTRRKSYRQSRYDAERAARNAAGYFTISDIAFGRSKL
ncbi:MAG: hypothetical protein NVV83_10530 [Afipia sp.]|nr:hypothetical protein [Afipia sp.]